MEKQIIVTIIIILLFWKFYQKIVHYVGVILNYIIHFREVKETLILENVTIKKNVKKNDILIQSDESISGSTIKQNNTKSEIILNKQLALQKDITSQDEFKKIQTLDIDQINKNFESLNKSIESLKKESKELYQIISQQNDTIKQQNDTIKQQNEKLEVQKSIGNIRFTQTKLNYNKKINILKKNYNMVLNSYKILYYRKIANVILDNILKQYNQYFFKTEKIFYNNDKPKHKQDMFEIIIAKHDIKGIKMKSINLLIDFLMFIKDSTSSITHLVFKYKSQIEILYNIIQKNEIKIINDEYYISSNYLIDVLFGVEDKKNRKTDDKYNNFHSDNIMNNEDDNNVDRINDVELQTNKVNDNNKNESKPQSKEQKSMNIESNSKIELNQNQSKNALIENNIVMNLKKKKSNNRIEAEALNIDENNKYGSEEEIISDRKEIDESNKKLTDNSLDNNINKEKNKIIIINKNKETLKNKVNNQYNKGENIGGLKKVKINDNKLKKIGEICDKLEKCELDMQLKEIVEEIKNLELNDLLKKDLDENNKNKIDLLIHIFDLIKENSENTNSEEETSINGQFLYNEWKKSFGIGYKLSDNFKLLVVNDDNINLKQIKDATIKLINNMDVQIFAQDPGKFAKYIKTIIFEDKFYEYNQQLTKN